MNEIITNIINLIKNSNIVITKEDDYESISDNLSQIEDFLESNGFNVSYHWSGDTDGSVPPTPKLLVDLSDTNDEDYLWLGIVDGNLYYTDNLNQFDVYGMVK
jgi:hypothetical protein